MAMAQQRARSSDRQRVRRGAEQGRRQAGGLQLEVC